MKLLSPESFRLASRCLLVRSKLMKLSLFRVQGLYAIVGLTGTSRTVTMLSAMSAFMPRLKPFSPLMFFCLKKTDARLNPAKPFSVTCAKSSNVPGRLSMDA